MNQRSKRARDRKRAQDIGASVFSTGGHIASHRRDGDPVVRVPSKTTGDATQDDIKGAAKASPFFKRLVETLQPSREDELKAIANSIENAEDTELTKEEDETKEDK